LSHFYLTTVGEEVIAALVHTQKHTQDFGMTPLDERSAQLHTILPYITGFKLGRNNRFSNLYNPNLHALIYIYIYIYISDVDKSPTCFGTS